jgi:hypothetical protein
LQTLDALRNRLAAAIEDQLVQADRRESSNVAGNVFRLANSLFNGWRQAGSLAGRNISVKRSDMLVPTYSAPLRVATRRPSPLVTHRNGQRRLTVRNG